MKRIIIIMILAAIFSAIMFVIKERPFRTVPEEEVEEHGHETGVIEEHGH